MLSKRFTLVELLTVVAIVAILMAILLPALARAKAFAQSAACQSNQKQIGVMVFLATGDRDNLMPPHNNGMLWRTGPGWTGVDGANTNYDGLAWGWQDWLRMAAGTDEFTNLPAQMNVVDYASAAANYGSNLMTNPPMGHDLKTWYPSTVQKFHKGSIFDCPTSMPSAAVSGGVDYQTIGFAGWANYHPAIIDQVSRGKRWTRVSKPDSRILFMDTGGDGTAYDQARFSSGVDLYPMGATYSVVNAEFGMYRWGHSITTRHMNGCNITYLDGHVEYLRDPQNPNDRFWGNYMHKSESYPSDKFTWTWFYLRASDNALIGVK